MAGKELCLDKTAGVVAEPKHNDNQYHEDIKTRKPHRVKSEFVVKKVFELAGGEPESLDEWSTNE